MYSLRWIGGNEQPDIFSYAFLTANFSPKGAKPRPLLESKT